ncbi:MAG: hypothetical protein ACFFBH_10115 [Promethearchaeota archaeon]
MRLEIKFRGKKYSFSNLALIVFPLGLIISVPFILQFDKTTELIWLQELFTKNVVFFENLFFNLGVYVIYNPTYSCPWLIGYSDNALAYVNNGCTGFLTMSIFVAVIIFVPHSQVSKTKENILWRKSIAIIIAISFIYLFNIFRLTIQIYLYTHGFAWSIIHDSDEMLALTVSFHIAIFLLCCKYIPELFLSIFYSGKLIITQLTKKSIAETIYDIKHRGERTQYNKVRQIFKDKEMDLYLIKTNDIDFRLMQFLRKSKNKYTVKAIKDRLFGQQENISEDLLDKMLQVFSDMKWILSKELDGQIYYYI